ncbi:DNA polymerase I [Thermaurantimonas aggregans]|uniref:DNA polymerase I n=1 Tax=Thermaurantimonas aggregans TaxID=2173829 RepID=A0A401XJR5_9FLAO|nr:DNA polymerase I [Thermaurantimonas aggregans]MCX8148929.1 DNA polymerase I [Thermaurantimonas aggregans]GCD77256.1 DNA polymerase I [Thermaurantimonas aggregans]
MTAPGDKKLFLLDAYALIFRSYFAFAKNPRVTSTGMDTSAIFGFITTLLDLIQSEKPSHLAVVFDTDAPTQRHIDFTEYKAHRDETPEAIKIAVPYIKRILEAMHIPVLGVDGYEADDVIGTLAQKAEKEGYTVYMVTPDKDFGQLVTDNILIYRPGRMGNPNEVWGVKEVCEKFDIERVEQVIDMLGMMGDAVDNIPGIPGVGEKTAAKLLKEYGTLENVLENASSIKGKLGEKIAAAKEQALLSKRLATILTDAPIEFDEKRFQLDPPDLNAVEEVFKELEFRTLTRRFKELYGVKSADDMPGSNSPTSSSEPIQLNLFDQIDATASNPLGRKTIRDTDHLYTLISDIQGFKQLLKVLENHAEICIDTETTSLDVLDAQLIGIAISYRAHTGYYIQLPEKEDEIKNWLTLFEPLFGDTSKTWIAQNWKYDYAVLKKYGIHLPVKVFDTMLAHYVINPDARHNMDVLSENYLNYAPISIESLIGKKGAGQGNMKDVDIHLVAEYSAEDADITFQLAQVFKPMLTERGGEKVFYNVEVPLVPVLADMEMIGVKIDITNLKNQSKDIEEEIGQIENEITSLAGEKFNIASPKQLGEILFEKLKVGGSKPKKTKTGQYATGEDVLQSLAKEHPIVPLILEYRQLTKLKNTYIDTLPQMIHPKTGRIHTSFNQAVAATGRLSSNNPNLQNIPIRTERGRKIREAFIAEDGYKILSADYSQIELRIIAAISGDEAMIQAFRNGEDIHAATAAKVFGVPLEKVTKEMRSNAKTVNFGIIYGVSAFGLSQQSTLTRQEASAVIEAYFKTYPGIKAYMENQVKKARETGYVETILGRRRYLPDIESRNQVVRGQAERIAINAPIQGSAADIIKLAMIDIHRFLVEKAYKTRMLLQVHDELVFEIHQDELHLREEIKRRMENAWHFAVPLVADTGIGDNWLQAH